MRKMKGKSYAPCRAPLEPVENLRLAIKDGPLTKIWCMSVSC